ncbi:peptidoglycan-binding protein [Terrihabitans soli]|uniref:Peptidoglycan-binding protein n=1 Tax=Terrihabitans soli TaxID=708113 RepID=A0A6S6QPY5_9HYPH|nr:L,D-transpeptidase family protein [Terrihabitans soli]BCJ89825.1 peptidoglycan-binding protein [Terrihabitans soli]
MRLSQYTGFLLAGAMALSVPAYAQDMTPGTLPTPDAPAVEAPASVVETPAPEIVQQQPVAPEVTAPEAAAPELAQPQPEATSPELATQASTPVAPGETVENVLNKRLSERKDEADVLAFYAARKFEPIWVADGKLNAKALGVIDRIKRADEDGLDPSAFVLPDPQATDGSPEQLVAAEIALSRAVAAFARQAQGGRMEPSTLGPLVTPEPTHPRRADVLALMAREDGAADWLDTYNPPHAGFRALKKKLAELKAAANEPVPPPPPEIPTAKKSLKPGGFDERVAVLRQRMGLPPATMEVRTADGETAEVTSRFYDPELAAAVSAFQKRQGLNADGVLGNQTVALLNEVATVVDPIPLVVVNMERWRWLPRKLGQTHIFVNVPEFMARIVRDGNTVHETRVITGSKQNPSPIFSDEMEHIIVNPAWNVPASIAIKEMLPQLQKDPTYLERQGFEVTFEGRRPQKKVVNGFWGSRMVEVQGSGIDWNSMSVEDMNRVRIRQPPGERNALGHIKFMFPNKHSVYLHDTPTRNLFAKDMRALSHGCIRVQDPFKLADVLLEDTGLDGTKLKGMVGGGEERRIDLAHKIPIHIAYFTAEVASDDTLLTRPDVYGTDKKMKAALGLGGQVQASAKH